MFLIQEIASALIAGVIVDWKRLLRRPASAAPQNQLHSRKLQPPKKLQKNLHVALPRDATQYIFLVS